MQSAGRAGVGCGHSWRRSDDPVRADRPRPRRLSDQPRRPAAVPAGPACGRHAACRRRSVGRVCRGDPVGCPGPIPPASAPTPDAASGPAATQPPTTQPPSPTQPPPPAQPPTQPRRRPSRSRRPGPARRHSRSRRPSRQPPAQPPTRPRSRRRHRAGRRRRRLPRCPPGGRDAGLQRLADLDHRPGSRDAGRLAGHPAPRRPGVPPSPARSSRSSAAFSGSRRHTACTQRGRTRGRSSPRRAPVSRC